MFEQFAVIFRAMGAYLGPLTDAMLPSLGALVVVTVVATVLVLVARTVGVVAERLTAVGARSRKLGHDHLQVYSIQELRAFFLFQAVVVPGFDLVYEELLGAWGQSLVHKHVGTPRRGPCTFVALSRELQAQGELLLALELADHDGRVDLVVAPRPSADGGTFDLARLRGCWVVAPDSGGTARDTGHGGDPQQTGATVRALR